MPAARRVSLLVAFSLLISVATVHANSAWVLWSDASVEDGPCNDEMMERLDLSRASPPPVEQTAKEKERLVGAAFEKASKLGYVPDRMTFALMYIDGKYVAYFSRPEEGALGGDLTIFLERNGAVVCFSGGL
jgi:hypothetical protein